MSVVLKIRTDKGDFIGELRGGWIEFESYHIELDQIERIDIRIRRCVLLDGTRMRIPFTKTGHYPEIRHIPQIQGEITIYSKSLQHEVTFNTSEFNSIIRIK